MLPGIDGISVTETIRVQNNDVPILILSARNASADRVLGLKKRRRRLSHQAIQPGRAAAPDPEADRKEQENAGQGFLRRTSIHLERTPSISKHRRRPPKTAQRIQLSKKEAMLLKLLIENRNEVVTREKILQAVWGYNVYPTTRTIDNFVLNFRKYFEEDSRHPKYFHSVRGVGYKYTE